MLRNGSRETDLWERPPPHPLEVTEPEPGVSPESGGEHKHGPGKALAYEILGFPFDLYRRNCTLIAHDDLQVFEKYE